MPGDPDPLYIAARGVLLDALQALGLQRDAIILVGAQAVYLHTGAIELPIAEQVRAILFEGKSARDALRELVARDLKSEGQTLSRR